MSWSSVRGHWPVGPRVLYERPIGEHDAELEIATPNCRCGALYTCEHVAALVAD